MSVCLSSMNFDPQGNSINHYVSTVYEKYGLNGKITLLLIFLVKELTRRTMVCFACASGFAVKLPPHMRLDELDYHLPREQIAQRPLDRREASRLLFLNRTSGVFEDRSFTDFPGLLRGDELLVLNNTRVIPARLFGKRAGVHSQPPSRATKSEHLTGKVEIFLTRELDSETWEALVRPGRKMQVGERGLFVAGELEAKVLSCGQPGLRP